MDWTDEGIVLSVRSLGETSVVATLLTRDHGRHAGMIRGGGSKTARAALQPGNRLQVVWKARLTEQLGSFAWDLLAATGALWLGDPLRLAAVSAACAMVAVLPEREPHPAAYHGLDALLGALADDGWPGLYARWELGLLGEMGYGIDLSQCAVTGRTDDLAYVSPKSGRAVGREAGESYRDRLLPLPGFLLDRSVGTRPEVVAALRLSGYFFERHVLGPQGRALPPARSRLVDRLQA
ncbi:MAG: DNA repair protein RecO [Telmatospirillum sp.]|nr:DNA repair protein RecO [Telmatospirillum sp.]